MLKRLLIFFLAVPVFAQVGGISRSTTPSSGDYGFWNRTNATIKPKTTTDTLFTNYLKSTGYISFTSAIGSAADVWIRRVNPGRLVLGTTATDSAGTLTGNFILPSDGFLRIYRTSDNTIVNVIGMVAPNRIVLGSLAQSHDIALAADGGYRLYIPATGEIGTATLTPRHKNSSAVAFGNLNAFNWYNSDANKNVSTAAQERDSSSVAAWFSGAQTPTFAIVNAAGATQFKSDSLGLTWGGGTTVKKILSATAAYNFGSIAAQTDSVTTITLTDAVAGDDVSVGVSVAMEAGLVVWGECTTNDQVRVHATNISAGAIDPANRTYRVTTRGF